MSELQSDDYSSIADDGRDRLIPDSLRRAAGAAVFLGLIAGMGLWAYRLGTRDAAEVPIIRAMDGPARLQPEEPGGLKAAHQGLEVNAVLAGEPAPVPRDVAVETPLAPGEGLSDEDAPPDMLEIAARARPREDDTGATAELRVPPGEDLAGAEIVGAGPDLQPVDGTLTEAEPGPEEADAEGFIAAAGPRPRSRPAGLRAARAAPEPPATQTAQAAVAAPATPAAQPESASARTATAAPREVGQVSTGSRLVQLGAYDSADITRQAWSNLVARHGDLLGSKSLYVERTTANARVFYRLRVSGFADTEETRRMCESLRARGVDCIPVTVQ